MIMGDEEKEKIRLLRSLGNYAAGTVVESYSRIKDSSRVTRFLAESTARVATKTGLLSVAGYAFEQCQVFASPRLQQVDKAMGRRIVDAFYSVVEVSNESESEEREVCTRQVSQPAIGIACDETMAAGSDSLLNIGNFAIPKDLGYVCSGSKCCVFI